MFLCYRHGLSNLQLMLFYGFALDNNPFVSYQFSLDLPQDSNSYALKSQILQLSASLSLDQCLGYNPSIQEYNTFPNELIMSLRLLLATDAEMKGATATKFSRTLSNETEENVKATLAFLLKGLMESLPMIQVNKSHPDDRLHFSWVYVKCLRKVLVEAIVRSRKLP